MSFFTNSGCNITQLNITPYQLTTKNKINSFISVLYKNNKKLEYKNFDVYLNGLKTQLNLFLKEINIYYTLCIDCTIISNKEIFNKLKEIINECPYKNRIIILKYDCPNVKENNCMHINHFGMLIRYIPYFNFDNNPYNNIFAIDIDFGKIKLNYVKLIYLLLLKSNCDFCFKSMDTKLYTPRKNLIDRMKDKIYHKIPYYIIGGPHCGKSNICDYHIFLKYINMVLNNEINISYACSKNLTNKFNDQFCYGMDEYLLNDLFINGIYDNNKKICIIDKYSLIQSSNIYNENFIILPKHIQKKIKYRQNDIQNNHYNIVKYKYYDKYLFIIYDSIIKKINEINNKYHIFKEKDNTYEFYDDIFQKVKHNIYKEYPNINIEDLLSILPYKNLSYNAMYIIYQKNKPIKYNIIKSIMIKNNKFQTIENNDKKLIELL